MCLTSPLCMPAQVACQNNGPCYAGANCACPGKCDNGICKAICTGTAPLKCTGSTGSCVCPDDKPSCDVSMGVCKVSCYKLAVGKETCC